MIKAKKSLGQNFLVDGRITRRILAAVSPQPEDIFIEIGPGTGALTKLLVENNRVIAIEIDKRLIDELQSLTNQNLTLIEGDALEIDWSKLIDSLLDEANAIGQQNSAKPRVRIVANLPYYISTPIIERLIGLGGKVYDLTVMLQKEVVERIASGPGSKEYGYLSVLVQSHCITKKLFEVPPSAFRPAPKIRSAVLNLFMRDGFAVDVSDKEKFFRLVSALFAQRRKTLSNNIKAASYALQIEVPIQSAFERSGIDSTRRAETLSLDEFALLYSAFFER